MHTAAPIRNITLSAFWVAFSFAVVAEEAAPPAPVLQPAKAPATLIALTDTWAVWHTAELIESTKQYRAPRYVHGFYRQKLENSEDRLIHAERDTSVPYRAAIMADGTFVLSRRALLTWHTGETTDKMAPLTPEPPVLALFPEGAVLNDKSGGKETRREILFVPFKGHGLDMERKVELMPAGKKKFWGGRELARHGDLLTWIVDGELFVYNLKTGERRERRLAGHIDWLAYPTAFDGETVLWGLRGNDAVSGAELGSLSGPAWPRRIDTFVSVRNRIGYYIVGEDLMASPLTIDPSPAVKVTDARQRLTAPSEKGLIVWDGGKFTTVAWLKGWNVPP